MNPQTNESNPSANGQPEAPTIQPGDVSIQPAGLPRAASDRFIQMQTAQTEQVPAIPQAPAPIPLPPAPVQLAQPVQPVQPIQPVQPVQNVVAPTNGAQPIVHQDPVVKSGSAKPVAHPNSTQNSLQIAEVRDGIVIMSDGSFRAVVMVKSINFDLMSVQEQESVEYAYQGFLNSLYFPIQIFIRSQKVDLQPYIEKLDKIRTEHDNMLLALMMEDYIGYIDALSQQTNIMDKKFYVVIPFFPVVNTQQALTQSKNFLSGFGGLFNKKEHHVVINEADLENAKTELRNRVQAVLSGLMQSGVQGLPLDTQELIELYYNSYNPDTATRQQLKDFGNLTADIVSKGQGSAPQAHLQRELQ